MTSDETAPHVAAADDRDDVVSLLVSAFYDDPTWSWALPDPSLRAAQHTTLWTLLVDGAMRYSWVWLAAGNTATSVWIPPGGTELPDEQQHVLDQTIAGMFGTGAPRVLQAFEQFDQAHPQNEPHYYLSLLGTGAAHRGHGFGLGLLADNLRRIDATRMPAYLEASNPANVPLYRRFGFDVIGSFTLPDGGPEVATMWRAAAR